MSASKRAIIEKVNTAFARNDVETVLSYCTEDFVWTMVGEKPLQGKAAVRKFLASGPAEPPQFSVDAVVAEGDMVIAQGDMTMNEGSGPASYSYCDVWRFRGEQIAELKAFVVKVQPVTT